MRHNAPGFFHFGMFGPAGQRNGYGQFWEPDMFPAFDILDDNPTSTEVSDLRTHRNSLPTNTYSGFRLLRSGGMCSAAAKQYSISVFRHTIELNGNTYYHYTAIRRPAYGSTPPVSGEYPVLLLLHGNTNNPLSLGKILSWDTVLSHTDFYTDQCVVVFPLYFGYEFDFPGRGDYDTECYNDLVIKSASYIGYKPFDGNEGVYYKTPKINEPVFETDYTAEGLSSDDVQILAILQSLKAVMSETTALNLNLDGYVGVLGGSLGAGMLYKVAPILYANGAPGTLQAAIALYGGTDQYAAFNVRRSKRWLASGIKLRAIDPDTGPYYETEHSYSDIFNNQIERIESSSVQLYMSDPSSSPPSGLKEKLRYWFLEDSLARYWQYGSGPYPLQIHHGLFDPIVAYQNSRWLAERMRNEGVLFDDENFLYYESPNGEHSSGTLSAESREAMADLLSDVLGY